MSKYTQFYNNNGADDDEECDLGMHGSAVLVPEETNININGFENPQFEDLQHQTDNHSSVHEHSNGKVNMQIIRWQN